jgi:hypothetical protein
MEVGPTGAEYEDILNQVDPLERYHNERNANKDYRSHNYNPPATKRPAPAPYVHVPTNAARDFEKTVSGRSRSHSENHQVYTFEPLEPTHTQISNNSRSIRLVTDDPLAHIRATIDLRPKTSAAACVDYKGPTTDSSSSTSRTATTYDPVRPSTGMTSLAMTPAHENRLSKQRVSEQILKDGAAASLADATAKAWMAQELSRRRGSETSGQHAPSRGASFRNGSNNDERLQSRAGSIRSGIKEYIRPRQSCDSVRSYSSNNPSRPSSRGQDSSTKNTGGHNSWWRGASAGLRRKGSWSSFRSARTDDGEVAADAGKSKEVNLNRSLPALPGLDQYKEKKERKVHIAQLMAKRTPSQRENEHRQLPVGLSIHTRGATIVDEEGLTLVLSADEEAQRQAELKRLVQEKMMHGQISPTASSKHCSLARAPSLGGSMVGSKERAKRSSGETLEGKVEEEEIINEKIDAVTTLDVLRVPTVVQPAAETPKRKGGFKARMSRFLGGEKRAVAAN